MVPGIGMCGSGVLSKRFSLTFRLFASTDWVPAIVKSGLAMGVLPDVKVVVAWVPIDEAAEAIVEMTLASPHRPPSWTPRYRHIVHPRPVSWLDIWQPIATHLEQLSSKPVRLVSFDDWHNALLESAAALADTDSARAATQANPAIKLLNPGADRLSSARLEELAAGKGAGAVDSLGVRRLRSRLSEGESYVLSHVNQLDAADVGGWIKRWVQEGFLPRPSSGKL
jgi:hypothetical protein